MKKLITYLILITCFLLYPTGVKAADLNYIYPNNVDDPKTVEEIQQELSVLDDNDGDLTSEIYVIIDNYTGHEQELGAFVIVFGVTDSGGREETIAITVQNVDVTAPVFYTSGETPALTYYFVKLGTDISLKMPDISAVDRIDGDVSSSIVVTGLEFVDTDTVGDYILHYVATDESGNSSSINVTISVVIDNIGPSFFLNGESTFVTHYFVDLGNNLNLNLLNFEAIDNFDGNVTDSIIFTGLESVDTDTIGDYIIHYVATDESGNSSSLDITISIVEPAVTPVFPDSDMFPFLGLSLYSWILIAVVVGVILFTKTGRKAFGRK